MKRAILILQILNRDQFLTIDSRQELDAGIDGLIANAVFPGLPEHNGAGTAIALRAALFGAGKRLFISQIVEQCHGRINGAELDNPAVMNVFDALAVGCHGRGISFMPACPCLNCRDRSNSRKGKSAVAHDNVDPYLRCRNE